MYGLKVTNGDVMKTRFPNAKILIMKRENCVRMLFDDTHYSDFPIDWWESLYKIDYEDWLY